MINRAVHRPDRVKLVYNAQIDSPTGMVLDYLLNHAAGQFGQMGNNIG